MGFNKDSVFKQEEQRQVSYEDIQRINGRAASAASQDDIGFQRESAERYAKALKDIRYEVGQYDYQHLDGEEALTFITRHLEEAGF